MTHIAIVDYGMGNIESVMNAFHLLDAHCVVSRSPKELQQASAIVLPGVGAFHTAMRNLQKSGLDEALYEQVVTKQKAFLGICLGLQLIAEDSSEQEFSKGLAWIKGHVTRLPQHSSFPIPHVGWNEVAHDSNSILFHRIEKNAHFFFDHSYHFQCDLTHITAQCDYGETIVAAIEKDNMLAVQFHPEKSQRNGLKLLRNFLNFSRAC